LRPGRLGGARDRGDRAWISRRDHSCKPWAVRIGLQGGVEYVDGDSNFSWTGQDLLVFRWLPRRGWEWVFISWGAKDDGAALMGMGGLR